MNTPEPYDPEELIPIPTQRRFGPWSKLGGGALTFAILIHVIVLTIAGIWIYTVLPPPKPPGIFVRNPGEPHGQTDAQPAAASIRPTQSIPSDDAPVPTPHGLNPLLVPWLSPCPAACLGEIQSGFSTRKKPAVARACVGPEDG